MEWRVQGASGLMLPEDSISLTRQSYPGRSCVRKEFSETY